MLMVDTVVYHLRNIDIPRAHPQLPQRQVLAQKPKQERKKMRTRTVVLATVLVALASLATAGVSIHARTSSGPKPGTDFRGAHYNLNLIGKKHIGSGGFSNPDRHTIMVPLEGNTKITMTLGDDFAVIDGNGLDGECSFQMPGGEGTRFKVYLVSLGKPSDGSKISYPDNWIYDPYTGTWYYELGTIAVKGHSKQPQWSDVTDVFWVGFYNGTSLIWQGWIWQTPIDLFNQTGYFWLLNGADKLLQVRFYPA